MKFTKLATTLLCSVILLCGCNKSTDVVLKVNNTEITRKEFYEDFEKIKKIQFKEAKNATKEEKEFIALSIKSKYLNDVIGRALLKEEFQKRKIEATDEELQQKKNEILEKVGSEENLKKILKENKISKERYDDDMLNEVKIDKLTKQIAPKEIPDKVVNQFYNQNKEQFKVNETVHAYHILINTNPEEIKREIVEKDTKGELSNNAIDKKVSEEVQKKEALINEIYKKATKNPKDFANLAKQYSEDPGSKENGGDLGYVQRETLVKEFADVAFNQKPGTIAKAKSVFGEHIIYVTDKRKAGVQPFSEIKDKLKQYLMQELAANQLAALLQDLRQKSKIEYLDESIKPETMEKEFQEIQKKYIEAQQKKLAPKQQPNQEKTDKKEEKQTK